VVVPEDARWKPGPTEGKTEKDGFTHVKMSFGETTTQIVLKGDKAAVTDQDGAWQSAAELESGQGQGRFMGRMARGLKAPATQAKDLVEAIKELKKEGEIFSGDMTEDGAKAMMRFGRGGQGPTITGAKGSAKFWVKEGLIAKYEFKVQGKMTINDNEMDVDRTTTVEIKAVGTTKVEVPAEAKAKL
jgi:hypothetical protein